jgi:hypothetical protein
MGKKYFVVITPDWMEAIKLVEHEGARDSDNT